MPSLTAAKVMKNVNLASILSDAFAVAACGQSGLVDDETALCVVEEGDRVRVNYMTNEYGRGWSQAAAFIFSPMNDGCFTVRI